MVKVCKSGRIGLHFTKSQLAMGRPLSEMLGSEFSVVRAQIEGTPGDRLKCQFTLACGGRMYVVDDDDMIRMAANERVWLQPV